MGVIHVVSQFPPPLRGRVREGGSRMETARVGPLPQPFPTRGRRAQLFVLASLCAKFP
jgi:hypothetical protein